MPSVLTSDPKSIRYTLFKFHIFPVYSLDHYIALSCNSAGKLPEP